MAKIPVARLFLALVVFTIALPALAQRSVSGVVLDVGGVAVDFASVEAVPQTDAGAGSESRWVRCDSQGRFMLQLAPGRYKIVAKREAEGYPDPTLAFNFDRSAIFPEVTVENSDISNVRVQFGAKGGFLYGTLRTQSDRNPVPHATVTISDARNKSASVQLHSDDRGRFQVAIPSKPVLVSAAAPGHTTASFGNGMELTLLPGEHVSVVIELDQR